MWFFLFFLVETLMCNHSEMKAKYWQLTPGGTMHDARGLMAVILNLSMEPIEDIEDIENVSDGNWQVM